MTLTDNSSSSPTSTLVWFINSFFLAQPLHIRLRQALVVEKAILTPWPAGVLANNELGEEVTRGAAFDGEVSLRISQKVEGELIAFPQEGTRYHAKFKYPNIP